MGVKTQSVSGPAPSVQQENNSHLCRRQSGGSVARGYLQAGLLSPLLWSVAVDELIEGLNENGCYTQGCADYIAILIGGKCLNMVPELFQRALSMV